MTKNDGREFATMTDEERKRFALEHGGAAPEDAGEELELGDPRDPDARDGTAALLDDEEHERRVEKGRKS